MRFTPHTDDDVCAMLTTIGAGSLGDLVAHVPAALRERATLRLAPGIDEQAVRAEVERAGFKLQAEGDFLRNAEDARDWDSSPAAAASAGRRGQSDRFALRFLKPG